MTTLRVGVASYDQIKARTMKIARGELKPLPSEPKVWFTSIESLAQVLSSGNQALLDVIASQKPRSLKELAKLSGRKESNLSRTLRTMESYGLVELHRGERGTIAPHVVHDQIVLEFRLVDDGKNTQRT